MIISHSNNYIFIRVPKNASTSLATYLVKNYTEKNDIYTGIGDSKVPANNISQQLINKHRHEYRFIHLTLNEIISEGLISESDARNKKIFGVIRHPLERQLSLFFFKNRQDKSKNTPENFRKMFADGYHKTDGSNHIIQTEYLKIGDEIVGEYWPYPLLTKRLHEFTSSMDKAPTYTLPAFKSNFKPKDNELINKYYDNKTRDAVLDYFHKDLVLYEKLLNEN